MDVVMVILRIIHVLGGVFWAGSTIFIVNFVVPAVEATGPEGQKFMQHLAMRTRLTASLAVAATLTALAGIIMYIRIYGIGSDAFSTGHGVTFFIGGVFGLAAWVVGFTLQNRTSGRMKALAAEIQAGGGPPSPEQAAQMQAMSERVEQGGRITAALLGLAMVAMAIAQYVG